MGDELDERLACISALADHEVAKVALGGRLIVGLEVLLARRVLIAFRIAFPRSVVSQKQRSRPSTSSRNDRPGGARGRGPRRSGRTSIPSCSGIGRALPPRRSARVAAPRSRRCGAANPRPTRVWRRAGPRTQDPGSGSRRRRDSGRRCLDPLGPASSTSVVIASACLRGTFVTRARMVSPGKPRADEDDDRPAARRRCRRRRASRPSARAPGRAVPGRAWRQPRRPRRDGVVRGAALVAAAAAECRRDDCGTTGTESSHSRVCCLIRLDLEGGAKLPHPGGGESGPGGSGWTRFEGRTAMSQPGAPNRGRHPSRPSIRVGRCAISAQRAPVTASFK